MSRKFETLPPAGSLPVLDTSQKDLEPQLGLTEEYADLLDRYKIFIPTSRVISEPRSAHQVYFGGFRPNEKNPVGLDIAAKPFCGESALTSATNEVMGYSALRAIGLETFKPVGTMQIKGQVTGITVVRHGVQGFDRARWVQGLRVENEADAQDLEDNLESVASISHAFARMHANGIFHPDGQIKNWGTTPDGKLVAFDTERMRTDAGDLGLCASMAWDDLTKFTASLIGNDKTGKAIYGVGLLNNLGKSQLEAKVQSLIIDEYCMELVDIGLSNDRLTEVCDLLVSGATSNFERAMGDDAFTKYNLREHAA